MVVRSIVRPGRACPWRRSRPAAFAALALAAALALGCARGPAPPPCSFDPARMEELYGIRPVGLFAGPLGRSSELRYVVTDAALARAVLERAVGFELLREPGGPRYRAPGPLRLGNLGLLADSPDSGRLYRLHLSHPSFELRPGDVVAVILGDAELRCLTVR